MTGITIVAFHCGWEFTASSANLQSILWGSLNGPCGRHAHLSAICTPKSSRPAKITPPLEYNVSALKRSSNFMLRRYHEWSTIVSPRFPRFLGRTYARANFRETPR
ncbi:hypothetical protein K443DRAFT_612463 [Laccaria amethystina LaAM-08-1]|uniref:Unplaced genomic scaffold K443scaffold_93, whole genome shotgun sequence n=1 Tax=Laccaria amethystina LaAM-08-1 TaxID=1095629 RepID=A0A0C9XWL4_9AGAR|nr:hypothetical protein K443DRAFT_612463 [Laccaria amethystina LaAM-08-1]